MFKLPIFFIAITFSVACNAAGGPAERDHFAIYAALEELCPQSAPASRATFLAGLKNTVMDSRADGNEALTEYDALKSDPRFLEQVQAHIQRATQDPRAVLESACQDISNYVRRPVRQKPW